MAKKPLAYRGDEPFVFVSYAHADAELAYPLIAGLQERGLRIWFDDGMDVGDIWEDVIPDHVEQCAAMLCLISPRFMDSNNCLDEIHYAKEQKKELLILHLEDEELPRIFQFRYGRYNAERLSSYSDRSVMLDRLVATKKLRCCLGEVKSVSPEESPEEIYQKGEACYEDESYEEAVKWYRKAAELGHSEAMCALGHCYDKGNGVPQSYEKAVMWYQRAADKDNPGAMRNLANCYHAGQGVSQSYEAAVRWYRRAADMGDAEAMNLLANCYASGRGVVKSYEEAVMWYRRGADKGNAMAMHNLAYSYSRGQGVPRSDGDSIMWYRLAADKGNAVSMFNLANCYAYGWGVAKDQEQAEYWRNKSKEAGV